MWTPHSNREKSAVMSTRWRKTVLTTWQTNRTLADRTVGLVVHQRAGLKSFNWTLFAVNVDGTELPVASGSAKTFKAAQETVSAVADQFIEQITAQMQAAAATGRKTLEMLEKANPYVRDVPKCTCPECMKHRQHRLQIN